MDKETTSAIDSLNKRMEYQESIHKNIDMTAPGFIHGVVSNLPLIITTVILSVGISYLVTSKFNKAV